MAKLAVTARNQNMGDGNYCLSLPRKPIGSISIGLDRGRFVISLKRDITASHPDSYTVSVGNDTYGITGIPTMVAGRSSYGPWQEAMAGRR